MILFKCRYALFETSNTLFDNGSPLCEIVVLSDFSCQFCDFGIRDRLRYSHIFFGLFGSY